MADQIKTQPSRGLGTTIFRNTVFVTSGGTFFRLIGFLFSVYVIRNLGDSRYGQYSIVLQFVGLFQIFLELGMTQYVMRSIAQDRSRTKHLIWNLISLRFLLALVGLVLIPLIGYLYGYSSEIVLGIFLYSTSFIFSAFLVPLRTVLEGHEQLGYTTVIDVIGRVGFYAFGTALLLLGGGYISLVVASLIVMPIQIAYAVRTLRSYNLMAFRIRIDPRLWPAMLRSGLPFGVISLFLTIAFSIDTVMLSWYVPDAAVGWYNVAYGLVPSITFFFTGFSRAIIPSLSKTYVSNPSEVNRWYRTSIKFILIVSFPLAVGGMLLAIPLIRFLYTDEYLPAAIALKVIIWDIPFLMIASFGGNITTIVNEERVAARIYGINTAANVILNLVAIPRFGVIGASLVTVVTDFIGALQFHFFLRRKMDLPNVSSVLIRVVVASTIMGFLVWFFRDLNLFLVIALGALVYGAMLVVFRVINHEEWEVVRRTIAKITSAITSRANLEERPGS
jgi:O-antigen/teichoic acid export membrane protein